MKTTNSEMVQLIHDITQQDYEIKFNGDFEGMVRIEYYKEYVADFYEHEHLGAPSRSIDGLEKEIIKSLKRFKDTFIKE